jgi:hypothetical protein
MPARSLVLIGIVASCVSSLVTLAAALLVLAPAIRAAPDSQAVQPLVRAQKFELVDQGGTVRATIGMDAAGNPHLVTRDGQGGMVMLGTMPSPYSTNFNYVGLNVRKGDDGANLLAGLRGDAGPFVTLNDHENRPRFAYALTPEGDPVLTAASATGEIIWQAP